MGTGSEGLAVSAGGVLRASAEEAETWGREAAATRGRGWSLQRRLQASAWCWDPAGRSWVGWSGRPPRAGSGTGWDPAHSGRGGQPPWGFDQEDWRTCD